MSRSTTTYPPDIVQLSLKIQRRLALVMLSVWLVVFALAPVNAASMGSAPAGDKASSSQSRDGLSELMSDQFMLGKADFDWLWWTIYQAKLFHPTGQFDFNNLPGTVLLLNYQMDIDKEDLLEQTMEQWQQLDIGDHQQQAQWLTQLHQLWPDVTEGDELIVQVANDGSSEFWFRRGSELKNLGRIDSASFTRDFLSIWLLERAEHQQFRLALLGAN
ncbi:hypothetical protein GCM10011369_07730 [Neiella marina]|uniref:Chalcone isomerase domain-containing protein n=1 Tax=Neiella marina TaxID=508461 RepID=A0A8J2U334_9GAMM|nr:chalcone isomerase family protein [Neiella marina]GGA68551.1 hypothetical protein GCM10011369_07730 [Neiella marina]